MDAQTLLSRVGESLSVRRVFGDPIEREGFLVVPVAFVAGGGGGGEGQMPPPSNSDDETEKTTSDNSKSEAVRPPIGSGGGLGGVIVPMGVYVIRGDKVVWKPAVQPALLGFLALSFVRLIMRAGSRVRS